MQRERWRQIGRSGPGTGPLNFWFFYSPERYRTRPGINTYKKSKRKAFKKKKDFFFSSAHGESATSPHYEFSSIKDFFFQGIKICGLLRSGKQLRLQRELLVQLKPPHPEGSASKRIRSFRKAPQTVASLGEQSSKGGEQAGGSPQGSFSSWVSELCVPIELSLIITGLQGQWSAVHHQQNVVPSLQRVLLLFKGFSAFSSSFVNSLQEEAQAAGAEMNACSHSTWERLIIAWITTPAPPLFGKVTRGKTSLSRWN